MDLASKSYKVNMNFPNLGPLCCMPRPKMMRTSWTLRGRLQYILAKGQLQKKKIYIYIYISNDNEKRRGQRGWMHCKPMFETKGWKSLHTF